MEAAACAVARIGADGPWVGFAPNLDDGYVLVVGGTDASPRRALASSDDLLALATVYFEESLDEPPDDLAATHGDIGSLVRHVAEHEADPERRRVLEEAVDAVDDGLAAEVTIARLGRALGGGDAAGRLRRRVARLLAS
ncbi:MAG: hypothetical protein M3406_08940 [Chloroflexota bacterium]|nr:hypothetical protein [Chloroflexota bacterium]